MDPGVLCFESLQFTEEVPVCSSPGSSVTSDPTKDVLRTVYYPRVIGVFGGFRDQDPSTGRRTWGTVSQTFVQTPSG